MVAGAKLGCTTETVIASDGRFGQSVGCHGSADMLLSHAGEQSPRADKVGGSPRDQQLIISTLSTLCSVAATMVLNAMHPCGAYHSL